MDEFGLKAAYPNSSPSEEIIFTVSPSAGSPYTFCIAPEKTQGCFRLTDLSRFGFNKISAINFRLLS
jgi:hypothetical protein